MYMGGYYYKNGNGLPLPALFNNAIYKNNKGRPNRRTKEFKFKTSD